MKIKLILIQFGWIVSSCFPISNNSKITLDEVLSVDCDGEGLTLPSENLFSSEEFTKYSTRFYHSADDFQTYFDTTKQDIQELIKIQREFERIKDQKTYKDDIGSKPFSFNSGGIRNVRPDDFNSEDSTAYYIFQCHPLVYKEYEHRLFIIYNSNGKNFYMINLYLKNENIIKCYKSEGIRFGKLDFKNIGDNL
ncbi:MAG: hypothetical protein CL840_16180 [Crocinitomicaceae bacterium]|nr:hypothetical protein [Crocinitomicaceae bacterium]|tara:strand:- start:25901 stop:26482 length:582 start_codon:yes stop_codon:yes gene_type:complete